MTAEKFLERIETESLMHFESKTPEGDLSSYMRFAVKQCTPENGIDNLFLELGVYTGTTLKFIRNNLPDECVLYGFDSFEGLPEDWINEDNGSVIMRKNHFSLSNQPVPPVGCQFVKGDVRDTLAPFLETNIKPIRFIHFDMDIYASTKFAIEVTCNRYQDGTVLVFDDIYNLPGWQYHAFKALYESLDIIPFDVRPIATVGWKAGWASAAFKLDKK